MQQLLRLQQPEAQSPESAKVGYSFKIRSVDFSLDQLFNKVCPGT